MRYCFFAQSSLVWSNQAITSVCGISDVLDCLAMIVILKYVELYKLLLFWKGEQSRQPPSIYIYEEPTRKLPLLLFLKLSVLRQAGRSFSLQVGGCRRNLLIIVRHLTNLCAHQFSSRYRHLTSSKTIIEPDENESLHHSTAVSLSNINENGTCDVCRVIACG